MTDARVEATRSVGRSCGAAIAAAGFVLAASCAVVQDEAAFEDPACGVAFEVPAGWLVAPDSTGAACRYLLRPDGVIVPAEDGIAERPVVVVIPDPPERAAEQAGFVHRDGAWTVVGRWGAEAPAEPYERSGLRGATGYAPAGCYDPADSTYVGICELPTALVGDDARSVLVQGSPAYEDVVERVVATLLLAR